MAETPRAMSPASYVGNAPRAPMRPTVLRLASDVQAATDDAVADLAALDTDAQFMLRWALAVLHGETPWDTPAVVAPGVAAVSSTGAAGNLGRPLRETTPGDQPTCRAAPE